MTMFRGINAVIIDTKGRVAVPTRHRDALMQLCTGHLILTIDTESSCLLVYPYPEWENIERKLQGLPTFNQAARRIQRLLIGHATDVEMDAQGRVLLPPPLREYASLDKRAVIVGQLNKLELWSDEQWNVSRQRWMEEETSTDVMLPDELKNLSL